MVDVKPNVSMFHRIDFDIGENFLRFAVFEVSEKRYLNIEINQ